MLIHRNSILSQKQKRAKPVRSSSALGLVYHKSGINDKAFLFFHFSHRMPWWTISPSAANFHPKRRILHIIQAIRQVIPHILWISNCLFCHFILPALYVIIQHKISMVLPKEESYGSSVSAVFPPGGWACSGWCRFSQSTLSVWFLSCRIFPKFTISFANK